MKHIAGTDFITVCGVFSPGDEVVVPALQSDCERCRAALMIGPPSQRGCAVVPKREWEPKPLPGAYKMLRQLKRTRDGK
jgi:hypothetical protein